MRDVTIDGETQKRDDGSEVCLGYYVDNNDNVISSFALPHGTYAVPDEVDNVVYVSDIDELPTSV